LDMPTPGVQVFAAPRGRPESVQRARTALRDDKDIRFVGTPLVDPRSGAPVVYTENAFVKFRSDVAESRCNRLLSEHRLRIKRALAYAGSAYFVAAPEGVGTKIFRITSDLLKSELVELCHPELTRRRAYRKAFAEQWHLHKTTVDGHVIDQSATVKA